MSEAAARPQRGEVYWVRFSGTGSEQQGRRPAVVVQNDRGNRSAPTTVVAIISSAQTRNYRFMVEVAAGEAGLTRDSHVNCAHLYTVDLSRLEGLLGSFSDELMEEGRRAAL